MLLSIGLLAKLHDKSTIKVGWVTYFPRFIPFNASVTTVNQRGFGNGPKV